MSSASFPHLFSPLKVGSVTIKNRIMSTGHDTCIPDDGFVNDALIAYHEARASGGAGLIVGQVSGIHESGRYTTHILMATEDKCIPGYRKLAQTVHRYDCRLFVQLFHPGREIMESMDGSLPVAYAPSAVPNERMHVMPRAMSLEVIEEITAGFIHGARRVQEAGVDGVEIVASHGYLPAQFINPRVNLREDIYGGSFDNRMRFLNQVIDGVRSQCGEEFVVGLRISGTEHDADGLTEDESTEAILALSDRLDYVNVIAGSSASLGGAIHIVPPMQIDHAYVAPYAMKIKQLVAIPVFVGGRINQPQVAEQVLMTGQADMCGMTRAMICDPDMANKAERGAVDDIRACIACNQACIGHFHKGYAISCIQHPETGRELVYGQQGKATASQKVLIAGGGPAGLKAAAVAAQRGHEVVLCEASDRLGGQALLAQLLPGRAEFGGIVTNLSREVAKAGVEVRLRTRVDRALVELEKPHRVIVATGATPRTPTVAIEPGAPVVNAWQVLTGQVTPGQSVVIADWRCDWIGIGLAELMVARGCHVRLAVNGLHVGESLPWYVRDISAGRLHKLGVEVIPYMRLFGCDEQSAYFQHTASGESVVFDPVDTLILAMGHASVDGLMTDLDGYRGQVVSIGDCVAPRTAEEAVLEGLKAAVFDS